MADMLRRYPNLEELHIDTPKVELLLEQETWPRLKRVAFPPSSGQRLIE